MLKKKIKKFYKIIIQKIFKLFYGNIIIPPKHLNLYKKIVINNLKFKKYNGKSYSLYNIKNGKIYTDKNENVAIIKKNFILDKISFQQVKGNLKSVKFNSVLEQGTPSFLKKIHGKVFNLAQGGSGNNYFHFMFDILPRLYVLKSIINLKNIDYFYISEPKDWQINILKKYGIKKDKLLSCNKFKHIQADEVLVLEHPWYFQGYIHREVKKIPAWIIYCHRKFFNKFLKKKQKSKKIFLDRSTSIFKHCQIENLTTIKDLISKKNFSIISPETFSFERQIQIFHNSNIIIGAHGAAFTNIIFCKPKTKIIEIIPSDHPNKKCLTISNVLNLRYFRIKTSPDNSDINFPFKIKLNLKNLKNISKVIDL